MYEYTLRFGTLSFWLAHALVDAMGQVFHIYAVLRVPSGLRFPDLRDVVQHTPDPPYQGTQFSHTLLIIALYSL